MTALLEAVSELAQSAALSRYDLPPGVSLTLINHSENTTFRVDAPDGQRWALRVHREGYHSHAAIASELCWLMELRNAGTVITPRPVKGRDGELIQVVSHPAFAVPRHVVLSEWEGGIEPTMQHELTGPFETLGRISAAMHLQARSWKRPAGFHRLTWDFESSLGDTAPHWGRWRDGIGVTPEITHLFQRSVDCIARRLLAYGKAPARFGLVHGDTRLANLLVDGDTIKLLDFDDSGFSWFMYDAATPFSFHETDARLPALLEAWKEGYRKVSALDQEDEQEIPTFIMLRRLLLVAWVGSHAETDLAASLGAQYTWDTCGLCENYLSQMT